jgi:hypothetical protein
MADKRIIILDKLEGAGARFNVAFWLVVPTARVPFYADRQADFVSAWSGISAPEAANFTNGLWTEIVAEYSRPDSGGLAQAKADLQVDWQKYQDKVNAYNPWTRYGTFWDDGGAWTDKTTA